MPAPVWEPAESAACHSDQAKPLPPGSEEKKQEETILQKPELTTPPIVVKDHDKNLKEPDKKKTEIKYSTLKLGDKLLIKSDGNGTDTNVYFRVEKLPEFPGGRQGIDKYLRDNIR